MTGEWVLRYGYYGLCDGCRDDLCGPEGIVFFTERVGYSAHRYWCVRCAVRRLLRGATRVLAAVLSERK